MNAQNKKLYNLEDRTLEFARKVNTYINALPRTISNLENGRQLVRSAGSIGANYIEANEALGKKDFGMRIKISRKEAKESTFWLQLTEPKTTEEEMRKELSQESIELMKIFGAIMRKTQ